MNYNKENENANCAPDFSNRDLLYYKKLLSMLRLKNKLNQIKKSEK